MPTKNVDYSLYLVTDSTPAILGEKNLVAVVEAAVAGGTTIVQYRDKTADTVDLIRTARALHKVTKAAGVPLLINDRLDVALAAGVEGIHIGQDDLDLKTARSILGPEAIIGVTANNLDEAITAARDGADYLGIGTVYATPTKENSKSIIGTAGVKQILGALAANRLDVKTVCIGGVNASNIQRIIFQSESIELGREKKLDGVAVVSAIVAADDSKKAASHLRTLITSPSPFDISTPGQDLHLSEIIASAPKLIATMASKKPLCHNMTNLVVQNFAANVALAIGSSPIMSNNGLEAADLASLGGSLVINMGTTTPEIKKNHLMALAAYNQLGGPVLFDPVGAGATQERREGVRNLMAGGYFDVIKGNEGEIRAVSGATDFKQHGVDSGESQLSMTEKMELVRATARRERNIVVMTGNVDIISDGVTTCSIAHGHPLLGEITGSGCALGTTIASMLAANRERKLLSVISGMLMYEIAAERAARDNSVKGPGTFVPVFIDELYLIRQECLKGDGDWAKGASVSVM